MVIVERQVTEVTLVGSAVPGQSAPQSQHPSQSMFLFSLLVPLHLALSKNKKVIQPKYHRLAHYFLYRKHSQVTDLTLSSPRANVKKKTTPKTKKQIF